ncbi:uncharacterized protein BKA55DRAFT_586066 [Fusarium redolens]|jgi:hypothetical protein|uniref:Uncharacterized protein n=1 Tax=Fusarium redolens TaxID=48865 RepID=A0A9P9JT46_FUSRE|nr:uncharacterized protein BKA55DRAFT_586066 [Fusarium redolens]KAH7208420.1 hypothetical protein BKA55DRAFT_586066 [Fusarium redolens]
MSTKNSEAISRRHYKIKASINVWMTSNADVDLSSTQEFTDLRNAFKAILSECKAEPLNITVLDKMLQQAEERRAATACAERLENMDKMLFIQLCQNLGPSLSQEWLNKSIGMNQLAEDTTPSKDDTQLATEHTTTDLDHISESTTPEADGNKLMWGFTQRIIPDLSNAKNESFQPAQLPSSQPDEIEPHTPRAILRTKRRTRHGERSSGKRLKIQRPQDKQGELDNQYSVDQSEASEPFTDDCSEASTEYCGDKNIENDSDGITKDYVHQST